MLKTLMLVALGLAFTLEPGSLFSANASDQRVQSHGFTCVIRDLGCNKNAQCCAASRCYNKRVNSGWVTQFWDIEIPIWPL
jgi:hypothetical protein